MVCLKKYGLGQVQACIRNLDNMVLMPELHIYDCTERSKKINSKNDQKLLVSCNLYAEHVLRLAVVIYEPNIREKK